jgi:hypothetical protein
MAVSFNTCFSAVCTVIQISPHIKVDSTAEMARRTATQLDKYHLLRTTLEGQLDKHQPYVRHLPTRPRLMADPVGAVTASLADAHIASNLLDLPDEVLLQIANNLSDIGKPDLQNLRLTCRRLSNVCREVQAKSTTSICLETTTSSLQRFQEICNSPAHAKYITQVNLIPRTSLAHKDKIRYTSPAFHLAIWRLKCTDEAFLQQVLGEYDEVLSEREAFLHDMTIPAILATCLEQLPNLKALRSCRSQLHCF